ncbi:MAG: hypothetical protein ACREO9_05190 [Lysobacterales bacterium]
MIILPMRPAWTAGSLDQLLDRVENAVVEQYRKGHDTEEARAAIRAAMDSAEGDSPPAQKP